MAFISIELGSEDWKDNPVAVCYGHANEKKHGRCRAGIPLEQERYGRDWYYHWDRVDILYDKEENQWMIKKISEGGFGVSGQKTSTAVTHRVLLD